MTWCGLKIKENYHVLVNKFHGNFRSKTLRFRKIKYVFRDLKWCFNASQGLKGLNRSLQISADETTRMTRSVSSTITVTFGLPVTISITAVRLTCIACFSPISQSIFNRLQFWWNLARTIFESRADCRKIFIRKYCNCYIWKVSRSGI